jgi:hypothetical protein
MLGFSLGKILLLVAMIALVWYGFKYFSRRTHSVGRDKAAGPLGHQGGTPEDEGIQDMETCSICGTFVPNGSARACGREGCPYPD